MQTHLGADSRDELFFFRGMGEEYIFKREIYATFAKGNLCPAF